MMGFTASLQTWKPMAMKKTYDELGMWLICFPLSH